MDDKEPQHKTTSATTTPAATMSAYEASPSQILRDQRRAAISAAAGGDHFSPTRNNSPDILLPADSSAEVSLLDGSIAHSTPYPPKFINNFKPNDDPFQTPSHTDSSDRSLTTPSTAPQSASSMEIFLGPQPLPFIRNRQRLLVEDFDPSPCRSKSDTSSVSASLQVKPSPVVPKVSQWRKEQMKKAKAIRPVPGTRERPIPLLHGPLSLPYARNPSGVDATVSDPTGYFSNVYGLRMANSPEKDTRRVISDATGRTVSSSSYMTSTSNASSRPSVVRDYNQIIGIKKDDNNPFEINSKSSHLRSLGLGKPAAPVDDAIHSASGLLWRTPGVDRIDRLSGDFKTITLVDPFTNQLYTARVPKGEAGERVTSVELVSKFGSKADASVNWRSKGEASPAAPAPPPPTNSPAGTLTIDRGVLTVEHLYEKFGHQKEMVDTMTQSLKSTDTPVANKTLSDSTNRKVNVQAPTPDKKKRGKARKDSARSRGTPGAGKHLKRPTVAEDDDRTDKADKTDKVVESTPAPSRRTRAQRSSAASSRSKSVKA